MSTWIETVISLSITAIILSKSATFEKNDFLAEHKEKLKLQKAFNSKTLKILNGLNFYHSWKNQSEAFMFRINKLDKISLKFLVFSVTEI